MKQSFFSSADPLVIWGILFIVLLLAVLFFIPVDKNKTKSRRRHKSDDLGEGKNWQDVSLKLEKHIYALRREIDAGQNRVRQLERDLLIQTEKSKQLQEKLAQERDWQKKEKDDVEKKGREIIHLRQDIKKLEQNLVKEQTQRLRLEREGRETQAALAAAREAQHDLDVQLARLKAEVAQQLKDMAVIREENSRLKKKNEEATFVGKSEYEKLEKQLKQKEKELEDFKRRIQREMS